MKSDINKSIIIMLFTILLVVLTLNLGLYVQFSQNEKRFELIGEKFTTLIENQNLIAQNQHNLNENLRIYNEMESKILLNFTNYQNKQNEDLMIQLKSFRTDIRMNCLSPTEVK